MVTPHLSNKEPEKPGVDLLPFTEEHMHDDYVRWLNDPNVTLYSRQKNRTHTYETCREFIRSFDTIRSHIWMIVANGQHIGNITYSNFDLAIMIGRREYWNKGYGTAAIKLAYNWLRSEGREVSMGTKNPAMRRVMKKVGYADCAGL